MEKARAKCFGERRRKKLCIYTLRSIKVGVRYERDDDDDDCERTAAAAGGMGDFSTFRSVAVCSDIVGMGWNAEYGEWQVHGGSKKKKNWAARKY